MKLKQYHLLFIFSILVFTSCSNSQKSSFDTKDILPLENYTLKNGLSVTLAPQSHSKFVTVLTVYNVGGANETSSILGISHLLEHMMFKNTKNLNIGEFNSIIEKELGGQFNAMTTYDSTIYYDSIPSYGLKRVLSLESERMHNLKIVPEELKKEKNVVLEEMRNRIENSDLGYFITKANSIFFQDGQYPYGRDLGGKKNIIPIPADTIQTYYDQYYAPNNAHLVIVGGFDRSKAHQYIKQYYSSIPSRKIQAFKTKDFSPTFGSFEVKRKTNNNYALFMTKIPKASCKLTHALYILSSILTDGESSILQKNIVQKKMASFIESYTDASKMPSSMGFLLSSYNNEQLPNILAVIQKSLKKLKNDPNISNIINEYQLKMQTQTYSQFQDINSIAMDIAQGLVLNQDPLFYINLKTQAISKKEILQSIDFLLATKWATFYINKS